MVRAVKWMPVEYLFGCRFWVEKAAGEYQRVINADGKRIGKGPNNSRAIQYAACGVTEILALRSGKINPFNSNDDQTRRAIKKMIEQHKEKKKWTSREIVQWFLDNGERVTLSAWYLRHYRIKDSTGQQVAGTKYARL
jgi:hypothetical protein